MPTFRDADQAVCDLGAKLLRQYHQPLADAGVTVAYIFAHATRNKSTGEPTGPALKLHGWPCVAIAKINSLKDRVEGKKDCTITIDGDTWPDRPDVEKASILDHELQHYALKLTKPKKRKVKGKVVKTGGGEIILDDALRPKIRMRQHDWELAGFDVIVERHKQAALEYQQACDLNKRFVQRDFNWG